MRRCSIDSQSSSASDSRPLKMVSIKRQTKAPYLNLAAEVPRFDLSDSEISAIDNNQDPFNPPGSARANPSLSISMASGRMSLGSMNTP